MFNLYSEMHYEENIIQYSEISNQSLFNFRKSYNYFTQPFLMSADWEKRKLGKLILSLNEKRGSGRIEGILRTSERIFILFHF